MVWKKLILFLSGLLFVTAGWAEKIKVCLLDEKGEKISLAHVAIRSLNWITCSNDEGCIEIDPASLLADTEFEISHLGFAFCRKSWGEIEKNGYVVRMTTQVLELNEVVILPDALMREKGMKMWRKVTEHWDVNQLPESHLLDVHNLILEHENDSLIYFHESNGQIFRFGYTPSLCRILSKSYRSGNVDALGKVPEEYRDLESFTIDPQRKVLMLNERTRKRIHFYDAVTGKRMGDKAGGCYFTSFAALSDGGYLLLGEQGLKYRYLLVDSLFREEGGVVKNNENLDIEYPFVLTCQNECVWFADLKNSVIYSLDRNTKCIKSAAQVDFGANKVPQNWFESPENKKDFIVEEVMKKNLSLGIGGVMKWRNGIVFTYNQGVGDAILPRWCVAEKKQGSISVISWLYDDYNDVKLSMFPFFCLSDCIGGYIAPQDFDYSGIHRLYPDLTMNDNYVLYLIQSENGNK